MIPLSSSSFYLLISISISAVMTSSYYGPLFSLFRRRVDGNGSNEDRGGDGRSNAAAFPSPVVIFLRVVVVAVMEFGNGYSSPLRRANSGTGQRR
nr:hypothetical protein Iba_chr05aCG9720 [Ipomoea batatas]